MTNYDPESDAYARGLVIIDTELPPGYRGLTNCTDTIWVSPYLLQRERRSTLAHELAHVDLHAGQGGRYQGKALERECDRLAALRLLDFDELCDAALWADSTEELAETLHVDHRMICARISALSKREGHVFAQKAGRMVYALRRRSPLAARGGLRPIGASR